MTEHPGSVACACGCGEHVCSTCDGFSCKWPGACAGKCRECGGGPVIELVIPHPNGTTVHVSIGLSFCSAPCYQADHDRAVAEGRIVSVSDITAEQLNELFKKNGLQLVGVGERKPS